MPGRAGSSRMQSSSGDRRMQLRRGIELRLTSLVSGPDASVARVLDAVKARQQHRCRSAGVADHPLPSAYCLLIVCLDRVDVAVWPTAEVGECGRVTICLSKRLTTPPLSGEHLSPIVERCDARRRAQDLLRREGSGLPALNPREGWCSPLHCDRCHPLIGARRTCRRPGHGTRLVSDLAQ